MTKVMTMSKRNDQWLWIFLFTLILVRCAGEQTGKAVGEMVNAYEGARNDN